MARHNRFVSAGIFMGAMALLSACGEGNLLEPLDSSLTLLEFETRMIQVRYTDYDGFPVQAATCRYKTVGPTNGALLQTRVAVTDAQGICRVNLSAQHAAAFKVVIDSDGASDPVALTVTVSNDAGGVIETLVADNASATVLQAEVRLMEDFDCTELDPLQPPPATTYAANGRQLVGVQPGIASELNIFGLKANQPYTVIAIGRAEDQTVSAACQQNIVLTEEQILMRKGFPLTLNLEDIFVDVSGNTLKVISQFNGELGLRGVAGLLRQMSDGQYDPVDYVLGKMAVANDDFTTKLITAYRPQLVRSMSAGGNMQAGKESLQRVVGILASVENIELHTLMEITDEAEGPDAPPVTNLGELAITHRFSHFTADLKGHNERLAVSRTRPIFESNLTPILEATATLKVENAESVQITEHNMTIPLADALVGKILMDEFGDYRLDQIITGMIDCSLAGNQVAGSVPDAGLLGLIIDPATRIVVNDICRDVVSDMVKDVYDQIKVDLENYRWDQSLRFQGTADMKLLPDGTKINRLVNGDWTDIGVFNARRQ